MTRRLRAARSLGGRRAHFFILAGLGPSGAGLAPSRRERQLSNLVKRLRAKRHPEPRREGGERRKRWHRRAKRGSKQGWRTR